MLYEFQTPKLPGQFVPEFTATHEEDIVKYHAKFAAQFHTENSTMPLAGKDFRIVPALPQLSAMVYMRALRDLLNMDYATTDADVPGRVAALYVAMGIVLNIADEFEGGGEAMSNALAEIAGLAAAAFGQVQHGDPWPRRKGLEVMLAGSMARELRLEQELREKAA
ncbi:hypothetical protein [Solidesulfovibrio sp. C21]|uniref:hypothetical protein n=1 Tax=Solidesulfovibrio sp. C21 TaxID=3398613 RepID=UPI0039FDCB9D